jgi:hypothetical protein
MSDVVSRVALAIAIVLLVVAGATLLIVINTEEVPRWLMNLPYTLSLTAVSFSTISLISRYYKELTPKKKDRITSIKNSSKKKKLESPDLSGFFRLMLEELNTIRMSMTGKAIHFPTVCNVCHILPKRIYKSVATCRDNIVFLHESEHTVLDMYLDRMEFDKLETEFPFVWKYAVKKVLDMESRGMIKERGRLIIEIIDRYDRRKD